MIRVRRMRERKERERPESIGRRSEERWREGRSEGRTNDWNWPTNPNQIDNAELIIKSITMMMEEHRHVHDHTQHRDDHQWPASSTPHRIAPLNHRIVALSRPAPRLRSSILHRCASIRSRRCNNESQTTTATIIRSSTIDTIINWLFNASIISIQQT